MSGGNNEKVLTVSHKFAKILTVSRKASPHTRPYTNRVKVTSDKINKYFTYLYDRKLIRNHSDSYFLACMREVKLFNAVSEDFLVCCHRGRLKIKRVTDSLL